jgi:hypothetical protein
VDANYKFLYVDIGQYGRVSDGGVYANSSLCNALEQNTVNIPAACNIPGTNIRMPYVTVVDDAFPLKSYMLKPYSIRNLTAEQRIFNYRLSRARRNVENVFGHICQRFRILRQPIQLDPKKVEIIVMCICCLHNFLLRNQESRMTYLQLDSDDSLDLPDNISRLEQQGSNRSSFDAHKLRDDLCQYFNSEQGSVAWQHERAIEHSIYPVANVHTWPKA